MEDKRPTLQQFFILMEGTEPWGDGDCGEKRRDPGDLHGITFKVTRYAGCFPFSLLAPSHGSFAGRNNSCTEYHG